MWLRNLILKLNLGKVHLWQVDLLMMSFDKLGMIPESIAFDVFYFSCV